MTIYSTAYYYHAAVPAVRVVVMRFGKITPIKSYKPLDQKKESEVSLVTLDIEVSYSLLQGEVSMLTLSLVTSSYPR